MNSGLYGKYPAEVLSYNAVDRTCMISVISHAGQMELLAEIEYPIGDKSQGSHATEVEIKSGDLVWIEFIQGDPRCPLITGWRNPTKSNSVGTRLWHHENMQLLADSQLSMNASDIEAGASNSITLSVGGSSISITSSEISVKAGKINLN